MTTGDRENRERLERFDKERELNNLPERPRRQYYPDAAPTKKGANPMLLLLVAIVVSALFSVYWGGKATAGFITQKDFDTKIAAVTDTMTKAQASMSGIQTSVSAGLNNIPNLVTTQVDKSVADAKAQAAAAQKSVADANTQIQSLLTKINDANSNISALSTKVDNLNKSITDQKTLITSLQSTITTQTTTITALDTRVKALETPTVPTTNQSTSITTKLDIIDDGAIASSNATSTNITATIKITVTNGGSVDISNPIVLATLNVSATSTPVYTINNSSWQIRNPTRYQVDIRSLRGAIIKAGKKWTSYIDINMELIGTNQSAFIEDGEIGLISYDTN